MSTSLPEIYLARHGETAWTISRQHTGLTDIPLLKQGENDAIQLGRRLQGGVHQSLGQPPSDELAEPANGPASATRPRSISSCTSGITVITRVGAPPTSIRRDQAGICFATVARGVVDCGDWRPRRPRDHALAGLDGDILLFSHGHFLCVLVARWLGLAAGDARLFVLSTAALSILGYEHNLEEPAILLWNDNRHVLGEDVDAVS